MTTAAEYREFAGECTRWAADEDSEVMRAAFLDMAKQWMEAALRVEGLITDGPGPRAEGTSGSPAPSAPLLQ